MDLLRFEKILHENLKKGFITIQEKELAGIYGLTFEI